MEGLILEGSNGSAMSIANLARFCKAMSKV
jgi:hypothetical protein